MNSKQRLIQSKRMKMCFVPPLLRFHRLISYQLMSMELIQLIMQLRNTLARLSMESQWDLDISVCFLEEAPCLSGIPYSRRLLERLLDLTRRQKRIALDEFLITNKPQQHNHSDSFCLHSWQINDKIRITRGRWSISRVENHRMTSVSLRNSTTCSVSTTNEHKRVFQFQESRKFI